MAFLKRSYAGAGWVERCGLKVGDLTDGSGPVGLTVTCLFSDRQRIEQLSPRLQADAAVVLGVEVRWVSVVTGARATQ